MTDTVSRAGLVSRIESEAQADANADYTTQAIHWGRMLGLLEVGAVLGHWTRRKGRERVRGGAQRAPRVTAAVKGQLGL